MTAVEQYLVSGLSVPLLLPDLNNARRSPEEVDGYPVTFFLEFSFFKKDKDVRHQVICCFSSDQT